MAGRGLVEALLGLLSERGCVGFAEAAALLRATPGEVAGAARRLAEEGLAVVRGRRVCAAGRRGGGCALEGYTRRGGVLVAAGGGVALVAVCAGGGGLRGLVRAARLAAAAARRLVAEGSAGEAVPLVVSERYAGRLVEGVAVVSPGEAVELAGAPRRGLRGLVERHGVLLRRYRRGMTA